MKTWVCGVAFGPLVLLGIQVQGCHQGLPPLRTEVTETGVDVHFETLGEYPSGVSRIRLEDQASGLVVWEVQKATGTPEMWKVVLGPGPNPVAPLGVSGGGTLEVLVPATAASFFLERGKSYEITIWSEDGHLTRTASFRL